MRLGAALGWGGQVERLVMTTVLLVIRPEAANENRCDNERT